MNLICLNLRKDYEYARISHHPDVNPSQPYYLEVKGKQHWNYSCDWYVNERVAKAHFARIYQSPKWGTEYPKPKWGKEYGAQKRTIDLQGARIKN